MNEILELLYIVYNMFLYVKRDKAKLIKLSDLHMTRSAQGCQLISINKKRTMFPKQ